MQREDGSQSLLLQHELQRVDLLNEDEVGFRHWPGQFAGGASGHAGDGRAAGASAEIAGFSLPGFPEAMNSPGPGHLLAEEAGAVALETRPCVGTPPVTIASILELLAGAQTHDTLETHPGLTEADILAALKYAATRVG